MNEGRVDISLVESPAIFIEEMDDSIGVDINIQDIIDLVLAPDSTTNHAMLGGLGADDHLQYYNQTRGDLRYEKQLGRPVADDYILSSKANGVRSWIIPPAGGGGTGVEYHNALLGIQGGAADDYYHLTGNLYNAFEYVANSGNPYLRVKLPIACDYDVQAYSDTGWLPPDIWESMPYASSSAVGGIQFTAAVPAVKYLREDGSWEVPPVGGGGGIPYPPSGIPRSTGAAWAASLADNSAGWNEAATWVGANGAHAVTAYGWGNHASAGYLTAITKAMVEAVLTGAITTHTHNYEPLISKATGYLRYTGSAWEFKNETYLTAITKSMVEAVLTGSIISHTHPAVNTANFSILEEGGKLAIKYGATVMASLTSAGLLTTADDVVAFGTP